MTRFHETLRRLAMIDEGSAEDQAGLRLGLAGTSVLDPKTAVLLQLGASVATGSPEVCLQWSAARAIGAGATHEITDVQLAIAPVAGLGRDVCAAPDVSTALGYDIAFTGGNRMVAERTCRWRILTGHARPPDVRLAR